MIENRRMLCLTKEADEAWISLKKMNYNVQELVRNFLIERERLGKE